MKKKFANILALSMGAHSERTLRDSHFLHAVMSDIMPDSSSSWQMHVIAQIAELGIAEEMKKSNSEKIEYFTIKRWMEELEKSRGIKRDAALWGLNCWADALGVKLKCRLPEQDDFSVSSFILGIVFGIAIFVLVVLLLLVISNRVIQTYRMSEGVSSVSICFHRPDLSPSQTTLERKCTIQNGRMI